MPDTEGHGRHGRTCEKRVREALRGVRFGEGEQDGAPWLAEDTRGASIRWDRVSAWEDKTVLGTDGGDSRTARPVCLVLLNGTLESG